jgi:endonuclease-8
MPEGHEIHRFAERQAAAFVGKKVRVESPNGGFPDAELLDGRKLVAIEAIGKHLGYKFGRDLTLHVHLGQFGDFWEGAMPYPEPKGALRLRMSTKTDWLELRGPTDCSIFSDEAWKKLEGRIGPDPLNKSADPKVAFAKIAKSKSPIGVLLMDQSVIGGIGNVYRAELLFRARIHPDTPGRNVSADAIKAIWKDTIALMHAGMDDRRMVTTLPKDRPSGRGKAVRGETHYVYRRQGQPCFVCGTEVESKPMAGRTVYWCPKCQPAEKETN